MLSVIIPTLPYRKEALDNCMSSVLAQVEDCNVELIIMRGYNKVGTAWNDAIKNVNGDTVMLLGDDTVILDFDYHHLVQWMDDNPKGLPVPNVNDLVHGINTVIPMEKKRWCNGVPIFRSDDIDSLFPIGDVHYFSDNWICKNAYYNGYKFYGYPGLSIMHTSQFPKDYSNLEEDKQTYLDHFGLEGLTIELA